MLFLLIMKVIYGFALTLGLASALTPRDAYAFDQSAEFALSGYIACNRAYAKQVANYDGEPHQLAAQAAEQCEPERMMLRKEYVRAYDEATADSLDQSAIAAALKNNEALIESARLH
ncbi:hypothetical protein ABE562_07000 [Brucella intermedia]|uniref:hypothetical protein n=1 Tax=Brucella intermedia TaxID=94625 RepID=UPI0015927B34|nr:hypothetical protein [Brucella intermedia]MCO7737474.1 hypothetical protein [Brucella intermedia]